MNRIDHDIKLLGPMSHGAMGQDTGNVMLFRRIPYLIGGEAVPIPALSAGALRACVRRALWREAFELIDLSRETFRSGEQPGSWDRLYAALANGGTIEAAEQRVNPDVIRSRRASMPILSLLGSALYSSHMAGRCKPSNSWLVCAEFGDDSGADAPSMWDLLAEESRVRHVDREEQEPEVSGVGPMPTTVETIIAGATLRGHAYITGELERSTWAHGLDLLTHLGGKSGQGFGEVDITHGGEGTEYVAWLVGHREPLRAAVLLLAADLGGSKAAKKTAKKKPGKTTAEPVE